MTSKKLTPKTLRKKINDSKGRDRKSCCKLNESKPWRALGMKENEYIKQRLSGTTIKLFKEQVKAGAVEVELGAEIGTYPVEMLLKLKPLLRSGDLKKVWSICIKIAKGKTITQRIVDKAIKRYLNRNNRKDEEVENLLFNREQTEPVIMFAPLTKSKKLQLAFISELRQFDTTRKFNPFLLEILTSNLDKKTIEELGKRLLKASGYKGQV